MRINATFLFFFLLLFGCGSSVFKAVEKDDPAVDATLAIEQNRPQDAIDILTSALEGDPNNYQYLSILSSAQAQLVGVDFVRVILKMATSSSDSSETATSSSTPTAGNTNSVTPLFSALPDATDANMTGLDTAIATLETIPPGARTAADNYKLTIFYTARLGLRTKSFDKDGDGQVTPVELLELDSEDAIAIITSIVSAEEAIAQAIDGSESTTASSEKISEIKAAIDASEGATDAEKLQNYLGS